MLMLRLKNISTGLFVFLGMSGGGFVVGGLFRGMIGVESLAPAYLIWALITAVGLMRGIEFARSNKDMP